MSDTPLNSNSFVVSFSTTTSQPVSAVTAASAVIRNLQCGTLTDQVVFSLTLDLSLSYTSGVTPVTDTFRIPYANVLSVPGTVAGMACDIAATITAGTVDITPATNIVTWSVTFTITANTFFPPPQAIDVDSNIAELP